MWTNMILKYRLILWAERIFQKENFVVELKLAYWELTDDRRTHGSMAETRLVQKLGVSPK
jgi:hypothetical protein